MTEEQLIRQAEMIYQIMNFIFHHRLHSDLHVRDYFCSRISMIGASCDEIIQLGVQQGWLEEATGSIRITQYAREYEPEYWKTFR